MRNKIYFFLILPILLSGLNVFAQTSAETDSVMRSNGKIYVVMAICIVILLGLFLYVISIDKKITKMEKENLLQ